MMHIYEDGEDPLVRTVDQLRNALSRVRRLRNDRNSVSAPMMQLKRRLTVHGPTTGSTRTTTGSTGTTRKRFQYINLYCEFRLPLTRLNPGVDVVLVHSDGSVAEQQVVPRSRALTSGNFRDEWASLVQDLLTQHRLKLVGYN